MPASPLSRVRTGAHDSGVSTRREGCFRIPSAAMTDLDSSNFFRDPELLLEPFAYFDAARERCPVWRESHHDVVLVTGYDEAIEVYNDTETFSSCVSVTGPFPGFPVPLEGDDVTDLI